MCKGAKNKPVVWCGPVAQLGARFNGIEEVAGSTPARSTRFSMATVYILRSESSGKYYIGCTNHLARRLSEHQAHHSPSTRHRGPWQLVYQEQYGTVAKARQRERELKSWKSHRSVQELVDGKSGG